MADQTPSIGRIVHYVLPEGPHKGEHRAAMIVKTWGNPGAPTPEYVNLQVYLDGSNDVPFAGALVVWRTSVYPDHSAEPAPNTWHWPELVPPRDAGA